jgi:hypothetical protein
VNVPLKNRGGAGISPSLFSIVLDNLSHIIRLKKTPKCVEIKKIKIRNQVLVAHTCNSRYLGWRVS